MLPKVLVTGGALAVAVLVFGQSSPQQGASLVSMTYRVPATVTLREPVVVDLTLRSHADEPVSIELGRNNIGNLQLKLQKPDGAIVSVDPRRPKTADHSYTDIPIILKPREQRSEPIVLDEWFGTLDTEGAYRLTIDFIGRAQTGEGRPIEIARTGSWSFQMVPRDEAVLRTSCARLLQIARTSTDADQARFAAKALSYVRDPIAVEYLERLIERGKKLEILSVDARGIAALEHMGTFEARDALLRARLKSQAVAAEEIDKALIRMMATAK